MENNTYENLMIDFNLAQEKKILAYFGVFKSISTLSIALIGLLIGLKTPIIPNYNAKITFFISIVSIGFTILFSVAISSYELFIRDKEILNKGIKINDYKIFLFGDNTKIYTMPWYYKILEIGTIISLICGIISLVFYVYFLEFN